MSRPRSRWLTRHVLLDLTPLRRSADFRALTAVSVPYQVYELTRSSLFVGLVSLAQLFPLIFGSLFGGSLVDAMDRRRMLLVVEALGALSSAGLALNADFGPVLWPLFLFPAVTAALSGMDSSARNAMVPGMVGLAAVPAANAMFQALFQTGGIVGPARGAAGAAPVRPGWRSTMEGLRFVRRSQPVQGAYLIDLNAMVFGMPRALFPALAANVFGGGATTVGLLYAAPGAGALLGALTSGWIGRVRRQGFAVICAVIVWGLAIAGFGVVRFLPLALLLLAVAGLADVVSAVFRNTIIQFAAPDAMRGRLQGVQMAVVTGGPRLGDLEAGVVATAFGDTVSVVSGGLACVVGALVVARLLPGFRHERSTVGTLGHEGVLAAAGEAVVAAGPVAPIIPADAAEPTDAVDIAEQEA